MSFSISQDFLTSIRSFPVQQSGAVVLAGLQDLAVQHLWQGGLGCLIRSSLYGKGFSRSAGFCLWL